MTRRFASSLRRHAPKLNPRQRFLILCEGAVTEPRYFVALRNETRNRLVEVEVIPNCGVPKTLVEYAVERKREADRQARQHRDPFLRYEQIWCVFDVDSHPNLPDAKQQARDNGLLLAISNPCFELWILLHFQDHFSEQDRVQIRHLCKKYIPEYGKEVPYGKIWPFYELALGRAVKLERMHEQRDTPGGNPSTGVHRLTEALRNVRLLAL